MGDNALRSGLSHWPNGSGLRAQAGGPSDATKPTSARQTGSHTQAPRTSWVHTPQRGDDCARRRDICSGQKPDTQAWPLTATGGPQGSGEGEAHLAGLGHRPRRSLPLALCRSQAPAAVRNPEAPRRQQVLGSVLPAHGPFDHVPQGVPLGKPDPDALQRGQQRQDLLQGGLLGPPAAGTEPHARALRCTGDHDAAAVEGIPAEFALDHRGGGCLLTHTDLQVRVRDRRQPLPLVGESQGLHGFHFPQAGFPQRCHLNGQNNKDSVTASASSRGLEAATCIPNLALPADGPHAPRSTAAEAGCRLGHCRPRKGLLLEATPHTSRPSFRPPLTLRPPGMRWTHGSGHGIPREK